MNTQNDDLCNALRDAYNNPTSETIEHLKTLRHTRTLWFGTDELKLRRLVDDLLRLENQEAKS